MATIPERTVSIPGQWANEATTNIPNPPVSGVSYRNAGATAADLTAGQQYDRIYDSARYNQLHYLTTGLLQSLEQYGVIPWSSLSNYMPGGICLGMDGEIYQALQSSGPGIPGVGAKPMPDQAYWRRYADAVLRSAPGRSLCISKSISGASVPNAPSRASFVLDSSGASGEKPELVVSDGLLIPANGTYLILIDLEGAFVPNGTTAEVGCNFIIDVSGRVTSSNNILYFSNMSRGADYSGKNNRTIADRMEVFAGEKIIFSCSKDGNSPPVVLQIKELTLINLSPVP